MNALLRTLAALTLIGLAACSPGTPTLPPRADPTSTIDVAALCNSPVPPSVQGELVHAKLINNTSGQANLSLGMWAPNSLGECGTYTYVIEADQFLSVEVMAGCYWGYAWILGDEASTAQSVDEMCMTDPDKVFEISIDAQTIGLD